MHHITSSSLLSNFRCGVVYGVFDDNELNKTTQDYRQKQIPHRVKHSPCKEIQKRHCQCKERFIHSVLILKHDNVKNPIFGIKISCCFHYRTSYRWEPNHILHLHHWKWVTLWKTSSRVKQTMHYKYKLSLKSTHARFKCSYKHICILYYYLDAWTLW